MKKLIVILSILSIVVMQSCSNEFELTENWKDITVIYGLLDASEPVQYIRVEKAFLDETTSALLIAQNADSIFYDDISVSLQAIPPPGSGGGGFFTLTRVDANLEGIIKEEGIFASSPNYLYKFDNELKPDFQYKITVEKANENDEVKAFTGVIGDASIIFPPVDYDQLNFASNRNLPLQWRKDEDAEAYDVIMTIHYTEAPGNSPSNVETKSLDWTLFRNLQKGNNSGVMSEEINGTSFYRFLESNLEAGNFVREFISADIYIYAGGEELNNYVNAGRASSGITSAETLPVYTNVENGLGIFSTRYTQSVTNLLARQSMLDTLSSGPYTKDLGFK